MRRRLWLALTALTVLAAVAIVPPMVSINRYKSRITNLVSESLGRPARLSSVELRLLPMPGFVLTDLTVDEDPAYGAEPVLHANTVKASIRLFSLWRGRLEISRISVDEASLNVVRTPEGRWNLDSIFRSAAGKVERVEDVAAQQSPKKRAMPLPYLEATNSRINFKKGEEKLPFSLLNTDLSFWQESPGEWRIRVRGQPARTDVNLDLADTGIVRLEASVHRAPELRKMPVHLDLDWREAQLGQLTRLLIGSDFGWRGDLTGELHLDGTADAAEIKSRLRATGVHREEFAPAAPMDFDASCALLYHYSSQKLEDVECGSPLGDGRIRVAGGMPGNGAPAKVSVEFDRIPIAAGLDALRTVRNDFAPGLVVTGLVSGKVSYGANVPEPTRPEALAAKRGGPAGRAGKAHAPPPGPFTGSFQVQGLQLTGGGLSVPIEVPKVVLEPLMRSASGDGQVDPQGNWHEIALETTVAVPAGGQNPMMVTSSLGLSGFAVQLHGQASLVRARELAHLVGFARAAELDALSGGPVNLDLSAQGPWLRATDALTGEADPAAVPGLADAGDGEANGGGGDRLLGTMTVRNATWKADYLANPVEIEQATLHLENEAVRWDPVSFAYGAVQGTGSVEIPACRGTASCDPSFALRFGDLDAAVVQGAILGAREPGTLLATLLARLRPSDAPKWPSLQGTVTANSLILGPVTLTDATADLRIVDGSAEITALDGDLLGGHVHGSGTLKTDQANPAYSLQGQFTGLKPAEVGQLLGMKWAGSDFEADGKIDLAGFSTKDLAGSVKGTLHFDWRHGTDSTLSAGVQPVLARFDRWTGDAEIANGAMTLKQNQVQQGSRKRAMEGKVVFGDPAKVNLGISKEAEGGRGNP